MADEEGRLAEVRLAESGVRPSVAPVEAAAHGQLAAVGVDLAGLAVGDLVEDPTWDLAVVAEVDGVVVGSVRGTGDSGVFVVDQLSVDPAWGRRGIGTALVARLAEEARARGFVRMVGTTFRDVVFNAPLYQRLGARIVDDEVLAGRREAERRIGLDALGERVVVAFDL